LPGPTSVPHTSEGTLASGVGGALQTSARGRHTLVWAPFTVVTGAHARSSLHSLPVGQVGAQ
jgi:hypothetical protein